MQTFCRFIQIAVPFIWLGLVVGLSFVEAPLKFQAPEITLERGLGIGRVIFSALNKIEIVLAVLLGFAVFRWRPKVSRTMIVTFVLMILALQTFWLLPVLDERAAVIIAGETPPPSLHHLWYIVFEVLKISGLAAFGFWVLSDYLKNADYRH